MVMEAILKQWNPWWQEGKVPPEKIKFARELILSKLLKLISTKEILVLTGVRRCGKSTLIYQIINALIKNSVSPNNIVYFNFDEPMEQKDTEILEKVYNTFLEINNPQGKKYVFFDEIQNVKAWEQWFKKYYDLLGSEVKFIVSGSNTSMLSDNLAQLLTGRMLKQDIFPLSFHEFLSFQKVELQDIDLQKETIKHHLSKYLKKGGFPEVVLEHDDDISNKRLKEYFDSILLRDIIASHNIRESAKLTLLANYMVTNICTLQSYNRLSKTSTIALNSLIEYVSLLENAYLIFQVNKFSYSLKTSMLHYHPKKIFCIDNGMRNATSFIFSQDSGKLAENLVFVELKRREKNIYYWKDKKECDFVIKDKDNSLTAINVSYTDKLDEREVEALHLFKEAYKSKVKQMIVITKDVEKKEEGIEFIPLYKWLLTV